MAGVRVKDIMTTQVVHVGPDCPLGDLTALMYSKQISCLVVCEDESMVGIITERDLARAISAETRGERPISTARDLMSSPVISLDAEDRVQTAAGIAQQLSIRHLPVVAAEGRLAGITTQTDILRCYVRELEELVCERTEELTAVAKKLEEANEAKSQFLANMSHEIRTPMTAVIGYTDEILEGGDLTQIPPERLHSIVAIKRNSNHLLQILNDILDLSKIEAGRLEVERIRFAPAQIVADVLSQMRVGAIEKGLDLSLVFPTLVPETIESDPMRVRQILINLLGNAIKFTDQGAIRLVTRLIQEEEFPQIQFEVIDPGIGMTAEQTSRLFEPFTQADSSITRKHGGTGLGLSICRRLVELLDGSIELESEVGRGSKFRITLPIGSLEGVALIDDPMLVASSPGATHAKSSLPTEPLRCRILLAEDGPDNQLLLRRIFERAGATVEIVDNGRLAIERALSARDNDEPFDVILMDMQMPVLDGYNATRALRKAGYDLPILALTAYAMEADRARCLQAGCDEFVTKPIDRTALLDLIRRCVREHKPPEAPES